MRKETAEGNEKIRLVLVAGTGNNGGDVFVAARHLHFWKKYFDVSLILIGDEKNIKTTEASINWEIVGKIPYIRILRILSEADLQLFEQVLSSAQVLIVGIFGTGFKGKPRDLHRKVIEKINANGTVEIISVDIPSGLDADSGSYEAAIVSDYTMTMHAPKIGMLSSSSARQICGKILVANIGIPA
jgi:hydroxyethylthiazole kinase-like uncharacterized protein yjeF